MEPTDTHAKHTHTSLHICTHIHLQEMIHEGRKLLRNHSETHTLAPAHPQLLPGTWLNVSITFPPAEKPRWGDTLRMITAVLLFNYI